MFFSGAELFSVEPNKLWKTDGTEAGTVVVKGGFIWGENFSIRPQSSLTDVNGTLYFVGNTRSNGVELWKSDGTSEGTVLVKDIHAGRSGSISSNLTNIDGKLFFTADDGVHGIELWTSDGTESGTAMVKDIRPGQVGSGDIDPNLHFGLVTSPAASNGKFYFVANDGVHGRELWQSDGTADGVAKYPAFGAVFVVALVVSAAGFAFAVLPLLGCYRCPRRRSRLRRLAESRPAIHYYCSGCNVQWDLGIEYGGSDSVDDPFHNDSARQFIERPSHDAGRV